MKKRRLNFLKAIAVGIMIFILPIVCCSCSKETVIKSNLSVQKFRGNEFAVIPYKTEQLARKTYYSDFYSSESILQINKRINDLNNFSSEEFDENLWIMTSDKKESYAIFKSDNKDFNYILYNLECNLLTEFENKNLGRLIVPVFLFNKVQVYENVTAGKRIKYNGNKEKLMEFYNQNGYSCELKENIIKVTNNIDNADSSRNQIFDTVVKSFSIELLVDSIYYVADAD